MVASAVNSVTDRNIHHFLAFVDQTTAEVATLRYKFDHQDKLVDAFNGDDAMLLVLSQHIPRPIRSRLGSSPRRLVKKLLIIGMMRLSNRRTRPSSRPRRLHPSLQKVAAKVEDNKLLKRKPREPDEW